MKKELIKLCDENNLKHNLVDCYIDGDIGFILLDNKAVLNENVLDKALSVSIVDYMFLEVKIKI